MFFKVINNTPLKMSFKRLSGLYAALSIRELVNSWFRFLMSRTGYTSCMLFTTYSTISEFPIPNPAVIYTLFNLFLIGLTIREIFGIGENMS